MGWRVLAVNVTRADLALAVISEAAVIPLLKCDRKIRFLAPPRTLYIHSVVQGQLGACRRSEN